MTTPLRPLLFRPAGVSRPPGRRLGSLLLLAGALAAPLVGCTASTPPGAPPWTETTLQLGSTTFGVVFGDPARRATNEIANSVAVPSRLAGRPDLLARGLGFYEYATVALAGPRWIDLDPLTVPRLVAGRAEMREALGIRADAPPHVVMDSFFRAAAALGVNDRTGAELSFPPAALSVSGAEFLARLEAMPSLPQAARAATMAGVALNARDNRGGAQWRS
jgi:hypothetical protein